MNAQYIVRIAFLDVGQGDTMIVSIPETGEAVIVDCVEPDIVFAYLQEQKITSVRGLIGTHLATLYLVNKHVRKAHGYLLCYGILRTGCATVWLSTRIKGKLHALQANLARK